MKKVTNLRNVIVLRSTSIINDSRVTKESIALSKAGFNVKILGWNRDGFLTNNNNKIVSNVKIIPIIAFQKKAQYGAGIKSIFKLIIFQLWLFYQLMKQREDIDIIHSCDFDTALPAKIVAKMFKKRLVYDIFDYYIDSHYVPKILKNIVERAEISVINKADLTIICTEQRKEQIKKANPKKCIVIYNTPNISENISDIRIIKSNSSKIKICYVGILSTDRLLAEIGQEIIKHENIELHIGGFGTLENYYKELSRKHSNIFYYGKMEYKNVLNLEKDCDILFATYNPTIKNNQYSAPNKLYESMALGKPIIVCKGTGIDKIVEKEVIGCSISYDAKEFINCIEKLKETDALKKQFSANSQKIYCEKYSWEQMEKILTQQYDFL